MDLPVTIVLQMLSGTDTFRSNFDKNLESRKINIFGTHENSKLSILIVNKIMLKCVRFEWIRNFRQYYDDAIAAMLNNGLPSDLSLLSAPADAPLEQMSRRSSSIIFSKSHFNLPNFTKNSNKMIFFFKIIFMIGEIPDPSQPLPISDDAPLFYRASSRGFFSPVAGHLSPIRLNAFRNVGRVMGLCLSQV